MVQTAATQTDMDFLTLCNKRLDFVKAYNTEEHFRHVLYHIKRWVREWNGLYCSEITSDMIEIFEKRRKEVSPDTANKDIRYLRATFNFGIKKKFISSNPANVVDFFPVTKSKKYVPPKEDVYKVIRCANPDEQDYLLAIILTAARMNEINSLKWEDVDFNKREITLWTRKKRGGNRESRGVPMVAKLQEILLNRYNNRDGERPWVFWHRYWSRKENCMLCGPYGDRKKLMKKLCNSADVKYFRFHPLRHFTASILDDLNVPIGVIQRILGHENRKTTEGYLHSVGDAERNAMDGLGKVDIFSAKLKDSDNLPKNMHPEFWLRKVDRPDYQTLCKDIKGLGFVGTGKKYGVSDNAVRKWKKHYESHFKN
jgi:integrase